MATEAQIKQKAYEIWEKEGRPDGKSAEHYFRAKTVLENDEDHGGNGRGWKAWFSRNGWAWHLLVVIALAAIIWGISEWVATTAQTPQKLADAEKSYFAENRTLSFSNDLALQSQGLLDRLQQQHNRTKQRAALHLETATYFQVAHYKAIILATLCGIFAAAFLLVITKSGWKDANQYVLTIFLVLTAATVSFTALMTTMKQKQNVDNNLSLYYEYASMENQISSFAVTGYATISDHVSGGRTVDRLDEFIHFVDGELDKYSQLAVELDAAAVPNMPDVVKQFGQ